jgi:hypothetical protein
MSTPNEQIEDIIQSALMGSRKPAEEATREIFEAFVIIPKADLPAVKRSEHDENMYLTDGENIVYTGETNARMWCIRDVAVWQFIANEQSARDKRRDELARELSPLRGATFRELSPAACNAIDRIIELEQAA